MLPSKGSQEIFNRSSIIFLPKSPRPSISLAPSHSYSHHRTLTPRYNAIHTQNSSSLSKLQLQQLFYKQRSSRKFSVQKLQRNRKYIKSSKSTRSSSLTLTTDTIYKQSHPINLKYHSIVYESKPYNYSNVYFPARHKYVKSGGSRRYKEWDMAETQRSFYGGIPFEGFNVVEGELDVYQSCYMGDKEREKYKGKAAVEKEKEKERKMEIDLCMGPKCKVSVKSKVKEVVRKWKGENNNNEKNPCISPWETVTDL